MLLCDLQLQHTQLRLYTKMDRKIKMTFKVIKIIFTISIQKENLPVKPLKSLTEPHVSKEHSLNTTDLQ